MNNNENKIELRSSTNYNFLIRLKVFFSKIFSKNIVLALTSANEPLDEKNILFNSKYENTSIEKIQKLYESGEIKEEEIPDEKLEELKRLYVEQIIHLDEDFVRVNAKTI